MGVQDLCEGFTNQFFYLYLISQKTVNLLLTPQWGFNGLLKCGPHPQHPSTNPAAKEPYINKLWEATQAKPRWATLGNRKLCVGGAMSSIVLKVHWHEMVIVINYNFFAPGHLVLAKNGAWPQKFINCAIRVEDRILERILSIRMRPSGVYLAYGRGHHAYT